MSFIAKCADCNEGLTRINYVRRLRPGEEKPLYRDPLCFPCWEKDNDKVTQALRERRK